MMRSTCLAVVAAFAMTCAPCGAAAQDQSAAATAEASAEDVETPEETEYLDQRVCRATARAASRLESRSRVCMTRREWRIQDDQAQDDARDVMRGSGTQTNTGPR